MSRLDDAKNLDIISYLSSIGYEPKKQNGNKAWFLSPIHQESTPSFVVSNGKWRDMGNIALEKPFGDIIDLAQEINSCSRMEAIDILLNGTSTAKFEPREVVDESKLIVSNVYDQIKDQRLLDYLKKRCVSENVYKIYTKEVHYCFSTNPEKVYFACGFKNDNGGWELRNQYQKYCASPKHYTTIGEGSTLNIFEGFVNYMSALCYFGVEKLEGTTIVLNGLAMIRRLLDDLPKYKKINSFGDWGVGGNHFVDLVRSKVGTSVFYDHRYLYPEEFDFNDLLVSLNK